MLDFQVCEQSLKCSLYLCGLGWLVSGDLLAFGGRGRCVGLTSLLLRGGRYDLALQEVALAPVEIEQTLGQTVCEVCLMRSAVPLGQVMLPPCKSVAWAPREQLLHFLHNLLLPSMPLQLFSVTRAQEGIPEAGLYGPDNAPLHIEESAADHLQLRIKKQRVDFLLALLV